MFDGEYKLGNGFSLFYELGDAVPGLTALDPVLAERIQQLIWNKAYDHSLTDFRPCGKNDEYRFFIIKTPRIKVSYRDFGTHWIVYSIVRENP